MSERGGSDASRICRMCSIQEFFCSSGVPSIAGNPIGWNGNVGDIAGSFSHTLTLDELTNVNSTPYTAFQNVYFQVEFAAPPVPEPSTGLLLSIALGASLLFRSVRRFLGFSVTLIAMALPLV